MSGTRGPRRSPAARPWPNAGGFAHPDHPFGVDMSKAADRKAAVALRSSKRASKTSNSKSFTRRFGVTRPGTEPIWLHKHCPPVRIAHKPYLGKKCPFVGANRLRGCDHCPFWDHPPFLDNGVEG